MSENHPTPGDAAEPALQQTPHYRFELLFEEPPSLEPLPLQTPLAAEFEVATVTPTDAGVDLVVQWGGGSERFSILRVEPDRERLRASIEQSWQWRHAEMMATGSSHALEIVHHLGDSSRESRIALLRRFIAVLIRHTKPRAAHLVESMQLADPQLLHDAFTENPYDPLFGFLNIRLYKIEGHEEGLSAEYDETVMDTLGLHALGLPDLQMHFKHLDPAMVAKFMDDYAHYLFEKGPIMETGHTLRGFADDQAFTCTVDGSILDPMRVVVDIDPGKPYSAGSRPQATVS